MSLTAYLLSLGHWSWLILALLLFGLETFVPGVHFLWFGVAAIIVGILIYLFPITWPWQLVIFAAISIATVFLVKRFARPEVESELPDLNRRGTQYVGKVFVVAEAIAGGRGKVRVGDSLWVAQGEDAPVGARVRVTGLDGPVLMVERATG